MRRWLTCLALIVAPYGAVAAFELSMPEGAELVAEISNTPDSYHLPLAPYANGTLPVEVIEGHVVIQAWRLAQEGQTTLQIARDLEAQVIEEGFEVLLNCGGQDCGGFDFRFNTFVLAAPDMYVDLFDFRALSARAESGDAIFALISKSGSVAYVQFIHAIPDGNAVPARATSASPAKEPVANTPETLINVLQDQGHVILKDLDFGTGSAALGKGPHASLQALAEFLLADQTRRVVLVGHTDNVGTLEDNVSLSRRRAASVLSRLVESYGVPAVQLTADGVGYLSPIAPNATRAGREVNRRVEAVLLAAE